MTPEHPLRILFGSLKHVTAGKHSSFMPVAIGFLAAYARQELGEDAVEVCLEENPNKLIERLENWRPNVLALSHYCWNAEVNYLVMRRAKRMDDNLFCVAGGPEFDDVDEDCRAMLLDHPEIDFFAYGEGETPFAELMRKVRAGANLKTLKNEPQPGFMSIHPETGEVLKGNRPDRPKEMDYIPSPYLTGVMDHFFDEEHAPMVQLARGCPYACTFCNAAQSWYNRVAAFSMDRVRAELDYIARKTKNHPNLPLAITDSNFGMFKRDIEVATQIRALQDKYGWPVAFDFTTGKSHHDRILKVNELMRNTAHILLALQSTHEPTLEVIKRRNIPRAQFHQLHREIKRLGMMSSTDLIMPLPEETKETFLDGLRLVTDENIDRISSNTLCLLRGTELNRKDTREKYRMITKWRLVPRQFGEYRGERAFEVEEVCVGTNTMSFKDYKECRGIGAVAILYSDPQFDVIYRHIRELGLSKFDLTLKIWERLQSSAHEISPIYDTFMEQTESELFDTRKELFEFYSRPENFERLKTGEIGDNLIHHFRGAIFLKKAVPALELGYDCLEELARPSRPAEDLEAIRESRTWATAMRDVSAVFQNDGAGRESREITLSYDLKRWYEAGADAKPLTAYKRSVTYRLWADVDRIQRILDSGYRMFGRDMSLTVPRIMQYYDAGKFWLECEELAPADERIAV